MERLSKQQQDSLKKLDTERLRARLIKAGFEEDTVVVATREELLAMMAEHMLKPPEPAAAAAEAKPAELAEIQMRKLLLKEQELKLREAEMRASAAAREAEMKASAEREARATAAREAEMKAAAEREARVNAAREMEIKAAMELKLVELKAAAEARDAELKAAAEREVRAAKARADELAQQAAIRDAELQAAAAQRDAEQRLRVEELRLQAERQAAEADARREEIRLLQARDQEESDARHARETRDNEREASIAFQTKRFGDILKFVMPRMPVDPGEMMTWWETVENLWALYEVPEAIRAKLLIPLLTPKAKTLIHRLSVGELADANQIKKFLLQEFRLTSREYRARFQAATRGSDETYALFSSRLKNLWDFYLRSRECDSFEKVCDLVVADRLKDTLTGPCLKYCLSVEGRNTLPADELAALADTFDINYTPNGQYRGGTVTDYKDGKTTNPPGHGNSQNSHQRHPQPRNTPRNTSSNESPKPEVSTQNADQPNEGPYRYRREWSANASDTRETRNPRPQPRCWTCNSTSHLSARCPSKGEGGGNRTRGNNGQSSRTAQSNACTIGNATNMNSADDETQVKANANRCVVEPSREFTLNDTSTVGLCDDYSGVPLHVDKPQRDQAQATQVSTRQDSWMNYPTCP